MAGLFADSKGGLRFSFDVDWSRELEVIWLKQPASMRSYHVNRSEEVGDLLLANVALVSTDEGLFFSPREVGGGSVGESGGAAVAIATLMRSREGASHIADATCRSWTSRV